ncbi:MAG: aspartate carbamoyltransferase catalytic subunit, partial [Pseudomonadota bacterium]
RSTFELAAQRLGARVLALDVGKSSVQKGETLKDTALNILAMGVQCLVIRHAESGAAHYLSQAVGNDCSVVNAGDGMH